MHMHDTQTRMKDCSLGVSVPDLEHVHYTTAQRCMWQQVGNLNLCRHRPLRGPLYTGRSACVVLFLLCARIVCACVKNPQVSSFCYADTRLTGSAGMSVATLKQCMEG